jgi:hypothetical protein
VLDGAGVLVERALLLIPGVSAVRVKLEGECAPPRASPAQTTRSLPIATMHRCFGHLELDLTETPRSARMSRSSTT